MKTKKKKPAATRQSIPTLLTNQADDLEVAIKNADAAILALVEKRCELALQLERLHISRRLDEYFVASGLIATNGGAK